MPEEFYKKVISLYLRYWNEMCAEGAWMGHAYATEYLADICEKARDLLREYLEYEPHFYDAQDALFKSSLDFDGMIKKVYASDNFTESEIYSLADIINQAFKDRLQACFDVLESIYSEGTGEDFDYAMEKEQMEVENECN